MLKTRSTAIFVLILVFVINLTVNAVQNTDIVDSNFNPQIQTSVFLQKNVKDLVELSDGKILAIGTFNTYNGTPVGALIRLNADATLDTTFDNDLLEFGSIVESIKVQPDGKILLLTSGTIRLADGTVYTNTIVRLNSEGTIDSSFNYPYTGNINAIELDANGRILASGAIQVNENGVVTKKIIRLKNNGTIDTSFNAAPIQNSVNRFTTQNNKILYISDDQAAQQGRLYRLNEDGTNDAAFTSTLLESYGVYDIKVQFDYKILILSGKNIFRISENGGVDPNFQITTNFHPGNPSKILLQSNGKITIAYTGSNPYGRMIVIRLLPNGAPDSSFTQYVYQGFFEGHTILRDGSVLIGDQTDPMGAGASLNKFIRLLPSGLVDSAFNPSGTGFKNIAPGKIEAIRVLADEKILIGGDFDRVNNIDRKLIARLNAESTLDTTFQIKTTAGGNYFSRLSNIYHFAVQNDGKIIVSGNFDYYVNGTLKRHLVRLNSDGSIDPNFILSPYIEDVFGSARLGKHKPLQTSDGKILVGATRLDPSDPMTIPLQLTANGSKDSSFNPTIFNTIFNVSIFDIALQSDGKILIAGRHSTPNINGNIERGFIARLNSNGTVDESFQATELVDKKVFAFSVLQNGQILVVSGTNLQNTVSRLNSNGSPDFSFQTETGANGRINAITVLPNNKILIGGAFTTYNNQPRQNLAMLNADGTLDTNFASANREVLCITVDDQGRALIGGHFTSISGGNAQSSVANKIQSFSSIKSAPQQIVRSYLARLIVSSETVKKPFFDFDGDGKSDFSIYRPEKGEWWYLRSSDGGNAAAQFGTASDKIVPADYTGDGKTDFAFFRPEKGEWYILRSEDFSYYAFPFGLAEDIPIPADYDGDDRADAAVYRPSTNVWYILKSTGGVNIQQYGGNDDVPVPADYNGDGKTDLAVYNSSTGSWKVKYDFGGLELSVFRANSNKPVPADYTGDGKADIALYDTVTNDWFVVRSENQSSYTTKFGVSGDIPTPADYDGDGKIDLAIYRPSTRDWWYAASSASGQQRARQFGISTDLPLPSAYVR